MSTVTVVVTSTVASGLPAQPVGIFISILDPGGVPVAQQPADANGQAVFTIANGSADVIYTATAVAVDANNAPVGNSVSSAPFTVPALTTFSGNTPQTVTVTVS